LEGINPDTLTVDNKAIRNETFILENILFCYWYVCIL
jgi:hypothetical protein